MSREPDVQRPITRFALQHPAWLAVLSAAAAGCWAYVVVWDWRAVIATAALTFVVVGLLWRPNGYARRREERLFPPSTGTRPLSDWGSEGRRHIE